MKIYWLTLITLFLSSFLCAEFELPEFHTGIVIQAETYFGEDDFVTDSLPSPHNVTRYSVPQDKFTMRSAVIEAEGEFQDKILYNVEIGMATCEAGNGLNIMLMDAGIYYKLNEQIKFGLMKGHVMRGFEMHDECVGVLTAEKAFSLNTFKNQCHPTGFVLETDHAFRKNMGLKTQLGILNGPTETSYTDEYDRNLGIIFHTPLKGISIGGFYNLVRQDFGKMNDESYEDGYRYGFGTNIDFQNIFFRAEYFSGKGFTESIVRDSILINPATEFYESSLPEDNIMNAYYLETAYKIQSDLFGLRYFQPYLKYQSWNKLANIDQFYWDDPKTQQQEEIKVKDFVSSFFTLGLTIGLDEEHTKLKFDYEFPVLVSDIESEEAGRLIVRLQTEF